MSSVECPVCAGAFDSEKAVRDHSWDAHGACHHCGDEFEGREALYTHWLDAHGGDLSTADRKRAETKVGERTVCPACGDRFSSDGGVADHSWDAHGVCFHCGEGFDDRAELHRHWLGVHGDDLSRTLRDRAERDVGELTFGDRLAHQGPAGAVRGVSMGRREYLVGGGIGLVGGVAVAVASGALGDGSDGSTTANGGSGGGGDGGGGGGGGDGDGSAGGGSVPSGHPSAASLSSQPVLGPALGAAQATIVAFEDPSCHACERFERGTFPELKRRLIDPGKLSFVYRGIPVVQPWGRPALLAMEATLQQSGAAFWALKDFYYRNQGRIGSDNVQSETRRFLESTSGVDAGAVMTAVQRESTSGAVRTDTDAARQAGVGGTPTFYLFSGGNYRTKVVGPQPYSVFANALGL